MTLMILKPTIKDNNIHHVRTGNVGITGTDKGMKAPNTNKQYI